MREGTDHARARAPNEGARPQGERREHEDGGQHEHGDDGRRERSQDGDGTSAGSEDEDTLGEARECGGGERDECGVVNETVVEATIQTRLQSVNGESVAAMEETKKAVEVETNAHSTRGICEHTG